MQDSVAQCQGCLTRAFARALTTRQRCERLGVRERKDWEGAAFSGPRARSCRHIHCMTIALHVYCGTFSPPHSTDLNPGGEDRRHALPIFCVPPPIVRNPLPCPALLCSRGTRPRTPWCMTRHTTAHARHCYRRATRPKNETPGCPKGAAGCDDCVRKCGLRISYTATRRYSVPHPTVRSRYSSAHGGRYLRKAW